MKQKEHESKSTQETLHSRHPDCQGISAEKDFVAFATVKLWLIQVPGVKDHLLGISFLKQLRHGRFLRIRFWLQLSIFSTC